MTELTLRQRAEASLQESVNVQNRLYDDLVLSKLDEEPEIAQKAYQEYQEKLGGFDVVAFRKCIRVLTTQVKETNPELFSLFVDKFNYIPEYITHRNCFDEKRKEILESDSDAVNRQHTFDALDRNRTRAHNGVIDLFNSLNDFADKHKITRPYPNKGIPFNKTIPSDRAHVADILKQQEPLFNTINLFMEDERTVESPTEKLRSMSLMDSITYFNNLQETISINENKNDSTLGL